MAIQYFKYSKKQLRYSLLFGILWLFIFVFYTLFRSKSYFGYAYLGVGIIFLATYFYKKTVHYAVLKNGVLIKRGLFPKQIKLDEVTDIRYYSGRYTFMTNASEMTINTMIIDNEAITALKKITSQIQQSKS